jgi:hypothetical protein
LGILHSNGSKLNVFEVSPVLNSRFWNVIVGFITEVSPQNRDKLKVKDNEYPVGKSNMMVYEVGHIWFSRLTSS